MIASLEVRLYNKPIGTLNRLPGGGILFAFNEGHLNDPDREVISQAFLRPSGELVPQTKISSRL
jgi:hypothetical protein